MSWYFRRLMRSGREPAHRGILSRADIPDIDPPSILALLDSQPLRTSRGCGINHLGGSGRPPLQLVDDDDRDGEDANRPERVGGDRKQRGDRRERRREDPEPAPELATAEQRPSRDQLKGAQD